MDKLPNELFDLIIDELSINDMFRLRAVSPALYVKLSGPALGSCVYLHPSPKALARFIDFCNGSTAVKDVSELILLGPEDPVLRRMEEGGPSTFLDNNTWPHMFTTDPPLPGMPSSLPRMINDSKLTFEDCYQPLLQAISKLTNVHTLTYSCLNDRRGYNRVATRDVKAWAELHTHYSDLLGLPGQVPHQYARYLIQWSDAEAFFGILAARNSLFENVNLGISFPLGNYQTLIRQNLLLNVPRWCMYNFASVNIKSLNLFVGDEAKASAVLSRCFLEKMQNLEVLRLTAIPHGPIPTGVLRPTRPAYIDQHLDTWKKHERLEVLEIVGCEQYPFMADSFHFERFLDRHKDTLKELRIHNVTLSEFPGERFVPKRMVETLRYMRENLMLREAVFKVPRLRCHKSCAGTVPHAGPCITYPTMKHLYGEFTIREIERVAKAVGVDGDAQGWDFGPFILGVEPEEDD